MMGRLPVPPPGTMPHGWEVAFTLACVVMLAIFGAVAVRIWRVERDPVPLLLLGGGALATVWEPVVDVLGLCWYPRQGQIKLFETLGRPIPLLVLFGYAWFVGGVSILTYRRALSHGVRSLIPFYAVVMVFTPPFELVAVHSGVYHYYGAQPLRVAGYPLWWDFVNSAMPVAVAVTVATLRPHLTGWRIVAVLALVPMVDGAVNAAVSWPVWSALNGGLQIPAGQLTGLATCGLSLLLVWMITRPGASLAVPMHGTAQLAAVDERSLGAPTDGGRRQTLGVADERKGLGWA
jgi:hypothetical protein